MALHAVIKGWAIMPKPVVQANVLSIGKLGNSTIPGNRTTEAFTKKVGVNNYVGIPPYLPNMVVMGLWVWSRV